MCFFRKKESSISDEYILALITQRKYAHNRSNYATAPHTLPRFKVNDRHMCESTCIRALKFSNQDRRAKKNDDKRDGKKWNKSRNKISLNSHLHKTM